MAGPNPWNETERKLLDAILDQIVPASLDGKIPAAGALGVADFLRQRLDADAELDQLFQRGLRRAAELEATNGEGVDAAVVSQLEREETAFFEALLRHTYMGYYSRADIRPLFGLSAKPTQPDGYDVPADDPAELAALIAPVKKRGRCYRPV